MRGGSRRFAGKQPEAFLGQPGTCGDTCVKLYSSECASPTSYHVCQKSSGGCLAWNPDKNCASGLVCYQGKCMSPSSVPDVQGSEDSGSEDSLVSIDTGFSSDSSGGKDGSGEVLTDAGSSSSDGKIANDGKILLGDGSKSDVKFGGGGGGAASGCSASQGSSSAGSVVGVFLVCMAWLGRRRFGRTKCS